MYREVTMIEVKEVLRLRGEGLPKKRIAAQLGLDPKTVRRYLRAAATAGVRVRATISDEEVRQVLLALHPAGGRPRGDGWARCVEQRSAIERWLGDGIRLTKIRKLLVRHGVEIAYPTLHRFAVLELQFGKTATTIPVLDGEPGQELQVDTGWVGWLTLPERKKRRFRAFIFTAVRSRHRFVYPSFEETTARAIEACVSRACLIWPITGSTKDLRAAYTAAPALVCSLRDIRSIRVAVFGSGPRGHGPGRSPCFCFRVEMYGSMGVSAIAARFSSEQ
jgi:hypothetical protein